MNKKLEEKSFSCNFFSFKLQIKKRIVFILDKHNFKNESDRKHYFRKLNWRTNKKWNFKTVSKKEIEKYSSYPKKEAAKLLNISETKLRNLLKKYGIREWHNKKKETFNKKTEHSLVLPHLHEALKNVKINNVKLPKIKEQ